MLDHRRYLELAMAEAEEAAREGSFPVGAVLVGPEGEVLSQGRNRLATTGDPTGHAEMDVVRQVAARLMEPPYKHRCTLYTTLEPCLMCTGALLMANIDRVVWALNDDYTGAVRRMLGGSYLPWKFAPWEVVAAPFPDLEQRMRELLAAWDRSRGHQGSRWLPTR